MTQTGVSVGRAVSLQFGFTEPERGHTPGTFAELMSGLNDLVTLALVDPLIQGTMQEYAAYVLSRERAQAGFLGSEEDRRRRDESRRQVLDLLNVRAADRVWLRHVHYGSPVQAVVEFLPTLEVAGGVSGVVGSIVYLAKQAPIIRRDWAAARTDIRREKVKEQLHLLIDRELRRRLPAKGREEEVELDMGWTLLNENVEGAVKALEQLERLDESAN